MSVATEILDVQGVTALTVVREGDDLWVETTDWRATVEGIVDATLTRVSVLEMYKALATEPAWSDAVGQVAQPV